MVTAIGLVASGAGLSLVTDSGRTLRIEGTVQIPLRKADQATVELCIIHRTGDDSPLLADFLAVARSMRERLDSSPRFAGGQTPRQGQAFAPRSRLTQRPVPGGRSRTGIRYSAGIRRHCKSIGRPIGRIVLSRLGNRVS